MMSAITGKLGTGKTLFSVFLIQEALRAGKRVATNLDLNLEKLLPLRSKQTVIRLPDHPGSESLAAIGSGNDTYDERRNGLIVLDECSHFLGARSWNVAGRAEFMRFLTHTRKLGWDVYLIVQGVDMIDSQVRDNLLETVVRLRNLSRQIIPLGVGRMARSLGLPHYLPRFHIAQSRYGTDPTATIAETWSFRGTDLFGAYDTRQFFGEVEAASCYLSPWLLKGRYMQRRRPLWHWPILVTFWAVSESYSWLRGQQTTLCKTNRTAYPPGR